MTSGPQYPLLSLSIALLAGGVAFAGSWAIDAYDNYKNQLQESLTANEAIVEVLDTENETTEKDTAALPAPFYMLIVGSDQRNDEPSRSDVMILTRVDSETSAVSLVSFPRDIMVQIDEHGTQKLNAAYTFDGTRGTVSAVKELTGLPITHYVEVHFNDLESVVDTLGGVDVNVPVSNDETGSSPIDTIEEGWHHFDGKEALAFARERYGYARGDFQRGDNQRLLIMAIANKVRSLPPQSLPSTILELAQSVSTDISVDELIKLASIFGTAEELKVYSSVVPCNCVMVDGVSYDVIDNEAFEEMLELLDKGGDPSQAESGDSAGSTATSAVL